MTVTLFNIFRSGGIFMWPLLVISILSTGLILERIISMISFRWKTQRIINFIQTGKERSSKGGSPIKGIDLNIFKLPVQDVAKILENEIQLLFDKMFSILGILSGLGGVAPLLGFIGTVSGMIASFQSISNADKVSVKLVASGISEALITTGFGLIIAVICIFSEYTFGFFLTARAHRIDEEIAILQRNYTPAST